jgi:hypothetical protein
MEVEEDVDYVKPPWFNANDIPVRRSMEFPKNREEGKVLELLNKVEHLIWALNFGAVKEAYEVFKECDEPAVERVAVRLQSEIHRLKMEYYAHFSEKMMSSIDIVAPRVLTLSISQKNRLERMLAELISLKDDFQFTLRRD